jgi:DNA-binding transcriptional LysR family regulator
MAESEHARPSGSIRATAPNAFGQIVLAQILFSFLKQHPEFKDFVVQLPISLSFAKFSGHFSFYYIPSSCRRHRLW